MMNHLEIKHLRMILAIADEENMTRAAKKLHISQSALSQQLKDIEQKLQIDLFHRTPKKMILSPSGEKLLATARQVTALLDAAAIEIDKMAGGHYGELKVATHCIFCFTWLPSVIAGFYKRFDGVEMELGTSLDPAKDLEQKKYDLIITAQSLPENSFSQYPLFEDRLVCIMGRANPLAEKPTIKLQDFHENDFITHQEKSDNWFYQLLLKPRNIHPKRFMTVGQPQAIVELVSAGLGMSVFPAWALGSFRQSDTLAARPLGRGKKRLTWSAVTLKSNHQPYYREKFIELLQQEVGNGPRPGCNTDLRY